MIGAVLFGIIAALVGLSYLLLFVLTRRRRRSWSPFGFDGKPRVDLLAVQEVDGKWYPNPQANDGFHPIGAMTEDGIKMKRDTPWQAAVCLVKRDVR